MSLTLQPQEVTALAMLAQRGPAVTPSLKRLHAQIDGFLGPNARTVAAALMAPQDPGQPADSPGPGSVHAALVQGVVQHLRHWARQLPAAA